MIIKVRNFVNGKFVWNAWWFFQLLLEYENVIYFVKNLLKKLNYFKIFCKHLQFWIGLVCLYGISWFTLYVIFVIRFYLHYIYYITKIINLNIPIYIWIFKVLLLDHLDSCPWRSNMFRNKIKNNHMKYWHA